MDNQNTFNAPPPPPPSSPNQSGASSNAIVALVLGILSWVMCPIVMGIAAWIIGNKELKAIDAGQSSPDGRTLANIGKWLGIINVILVTLGVILYIVIFVFIIGMAAVSN